MVLSDLFLSVLEYNLKEIAYAADVAQLGYVPDVPAPTLIVGCVTGARLNRARVIQTGARERNQSREEKVVCVCSLARVSALSRACLLSRARVCSLARVLLARERLLRRLD